MGFGQSAQTAAVGPKDISARALLGNIAGRLDGIASRLNDANENLHGGSEPPGAIAGGSPSTGTVHGLTDHISMLVNLIDNRLETLLARL